MLKNVYKYDEMKRSEHMAVRSSVGWYYWTHQLLEVTGPDAAAFLDKMCANPIANLAVGRERYTTMLNEQGQIVDDVVVIRLQEETFWVSTLFIKKMIPWFDAHKEGADVNYTDVTKKWDMYAVQGPRSKELVNALVETPVDDLKFFSIMDIPLTGSRLRSTGPASPVKSGDMRYTWHRTKETVWKKSCALPARSWMPEKSRISRSWPFLCRPRQASITCGI